MPDIFPGSDYNLSFNHRLRVNQTVNSFGSLYEQRIVHDLAVGPRSDGLGNQVTYVGRNLFTLQFDKLKFRSVPFAGNANIDNSIEAIWQFFLDVFYDSGGGTPQSVPFYVYNRNENDDVTTWTGDASSSGTNSRGEAVTEVTGRYLVRLVESEWTYEMVRQCLYSFGLDVIEVNE